MGRFLLVVLGWMIAAAPIWQAAPARGAEKSVEMSAEVPAQKWKATRLQNVNRGATLDIDLTSDGDVTIMLLDDDSYEQYPDVTTPLFRSASTHHARFSIVVPERGDYFLVVDNSEGDFTRHYTVRIQARLDVTRLEKDKPSAGDARLQLKMLTLALQKAFIADNLEIKLGACGQSNAFTQDSTVILCAEYVKDLIKRLDDKQKMNDIVLFTLMHEVGHVLLSEWKYPFHGNEEVVDEFATVLLIMFDRKRAARTQAEHFATVPPEPEIENKLRRNDRHPLSIQRAENIRGWLNDPDLVRKWQPFLIPKMQTDFLRLLREKQRPWAPSRLIQLELENRSRPSQDS